MFGLGMMHVLMCMIKRRWQGCVYEGGGAKCLSKYGPFQQRSAIYNLDELVVSLLNVPALKHARTQNVLFLD